MRRGALQVCAAMTAAAWICLGSTRGDAHKPITSPFTFNEDVFPIVSERCGGCHYPGGAGPMSLMTHADAVPWGESLRAELMAGHMPPWGIQRGADRFRNVRGLTARELNVLLTWASGGTPAGDPDKAPAPTAAAAAWPLGSPDLVLPMPAEVTVPGDVQEHVAEFTIPLGAESPRRIRAIDVRPGTPAIVRNATVSVKTVNPRDGAVGAERLIALWLPGDHPVPLDQGSAFELPAGAELLVRIRYRKTWEYENRAMSDRSSLGVYFAAEPASVVQSLELSADAASPSAGPASTMLADDMRLIAFYPHPDVGGVSVRIVAVRPDRSRDELIAFRPRAGWARRYWLREPLVLPRGTRIEMVVRPDEGELLPPGALPQTAPSNAEQIRVTLNILPGA